MNIRWKPITDYPNYSVSNTGLVRSTKQKIILKSGTQSSGYETVRLYNNTCKPKSFLVHRLVAIAFIKNDNGHDTVDHIDGDKNNNNYINLQWLSIAQNITKSRGYACVFISPEGKIFSGVSIRSFCREHGLEQGAMSLVYRGKQLTHNGWTLSSTSS